MSNKAPELVRRLGGRRSKEDASKAADEYTQYFANADAGSRQAAYADVVNKYYDLATSFYEYGWGESFHFAHRYAWEPLNDSLKRHEHYLALRLQLQPSHKVLDVGAGIGGPLRELAALSGASITGLNNNTHQVDRGNEILSACKSLPYCEMVQGDFMDLPFADNTFDHAYQIEATCHAPDTTAAYSEIYRTMKPGGIFASYEWCLTDIFDPNNPEHCSIKEKIMVGNGLPELRHYSVIVQALKDAGFEVLEARDFAQSSEVPWYHPIDPHRRLTLEQFKTTWLGRNITHYAVWLLELLRIAPKGTMSTSSFLKKGADGLVAGGKTGIYTTMFFTLCRKPAQE